MDDFFTLLDEINLMWGLLMKPNNNDTILHKDEKTLMEKIVKKLQLQGINAQVCKKITFTNRCLTT
jgi:hypothetical protein